MEQLITRDEFKKLEKDVTDIKATLSKIHTALVGNEIAEDGGIVRRLFEAEAKLKKLEENLEKIERKQLKHNIHTNILWGTAGFVACGIISYVLLLIFKR